MNGTTGTTPPFAPPTAAPGPTPAPGPFPAPGPAAPAGWPGDASPSAAPLTRASHAAPTLPRGGRAASRRTGSPGSGAGLPPQRVVVALVAAGLVTGAVAGVVSTVVSPAAPAKADVRQASPTASASARPTTAPSAVPTRTATSAKPITTVSATRAAIQPFVEDPGADPSLTLVLIDQVTNGPRGVTLRVRPAQLLRDQQAYLYYISQGQQPHPMAVVAQGEGRGPGGGGGSRVRLNSDATVYGQYLIGDRQSVNRRTYSVAEFSGLAEQSIGENQPVPAWLRLSDRTATYLAEQPLD